MKIERTFTWAVKGPAHGGPGDDRQRPATAGLTKRSRARALLMTSAILLGGMLLPLPLGAQKKAILPVDAPPELFQELNQQLQDQAARQSVGGVLGPTGVQERLARLLTRDPLVEQAKTQIALAGEHALYMKREQAVSAASAAISSLERIHGSMVFPRLMAQAHEALALALLLHPEDEEGAVAAFRSAINADSAYQPNPNRRTSKVLRLVKLARQRWYTPRSPAAEEMASLAHTLAMTQLVWLSVRRADQNLALQATLFDQRGNPVASRRTTEVSSGEVVAKTASLVIQLLDPPQGDASRAVSKERPKVQMAPLPSRDLPPVPNKLDHWYKKWWVWTAVGIVLVGTGVGIALTVQGEAASPTPGAVDVEFTF